MTPSSNALALLRGTEGYASRAYPDGMSNGVQMYSIGYGHQIKSGESYLLSASIDEDKAMQLLSSDSEDIIDQINSNSDWPLNQSEFDALWDFGYNCGSGALANVLDTWNATRDPLATTARMKLYNKTHRNGELVVDQGLVNRREAESNLFLSEAPPAGVSVTGNSAVITGVLIALVVGVTLWTLK